VNKWSVISVPPPYNIAGFTPYPPDPLISYPYCDRSGFVAIKWIAAGTNSNYGKYTVFFIDLKCHLAKGGIPWFKFIYWEGWNIYRRSSSKLTNYY
jgi:hypothetical protein